METKTAKITSVQENQGNWNYQGTTYYKHLINFEGSDHVWTYDSKSDKCEKFKVGQVQTFDTDIKQNGQYTNYKIKPAKEQNGQYTKKETKDQGIITWLSCFSSVCHLFAEKQGSNSVRFEDALSATDKAFERAMSKSTLK